MEKDRFNHLATAILQQPTLIRCCLKLGRYIEGSNKGLCCSLSFDNEASSRAEKYSFTEAINAVENALGLSCPANLPSVSFRSFSFRSANVALCFVEMSLDSLATCVPCCCVSLLAIGFWWPHRQHAHESFGCKTEVGCGREILD
eukprot:scaffold3236_cov66-Cylindrotheca_fusiformis.AAC.35